MKIPLSRLRPLPTPPETLSITLEHRTGRIVLPLDLTGARSWLAAKAAAQVRAQALADARREAERRAAAEKAREEAEAKQRVLDYLREKRWYDWSGACVDIRVMHEIVCHGMPSDYETENCKVNQRQMIKRGTLFQLPNVHRKISYDARRQQFTFEIPAFLNGELGLSEECAYETCTVTGVSAKGSGFSGGNAPFSVWQRRFNKALERLASRAAAFKVDAEDLPDPRSFEKTVQVDALVRVVKQETASVGDWFGLSLVVVKVVGLRAHVEGTAWLHVVRPGPQQIRERQRCAL